MASGGGSVKSILDRPLVLRPRGEVSLSAFAFLFSEMVQYTQERSQSVDDMQVNSCCLYLSLLFIIFVYFKAFKKCFCLQNSSDGLSALDIR